MLDSFQIDEAVHKMATWLRDTRILAKLSSGYHGYMMQLVQHIINSAWHISGIYIEYKPNWNKL